MPKSTIGSEIKNTEKSYPALPLRDMVAFPQTIVPLFVGRKKSVLALEEAMKGDCQVFLVSQKDAMEDDPDTKDLYDYGTIAQVLQLVKLPDGTVKVLVEGLSRAKIISFDIDNDYYRTTLEEVAVYGGETIEDKALIKSLLQDFSEYVQLNKKVAVELTGAVSQIENHSKLVDTIASHLSIKLSDKQQLLSDPCVSTRLEKLLSFIETEIAVLKMEQKIRLRVKDQMEKTQKEYYLNEQIKAIQKELNDGDEAGDDISTLKAQIQKLKLTKEAREKANSELKKLKNMSPLSAEASVIRNYLDWLVSIPWNEKSKIKQDLSYAESVLDADHYGLDFVKERIIEHLAVQARSNKLKGPILCLVGPPGVGKTSLAQSIAKATGRSFVRMSLGGVRDEAEIRGHRRTYIGAMPGKIIQSMKKAGKTNALFLLDEVDKMGQDFRGDPASALLEVLDPEQNSTFMDHYLEVEYNLSDIMFITTANTMNIQPALLDRMEIIRLSGYTEDEKMQITRLYLLPKAIKDHGLKEKEIFVGDSVLRTIIQDYTREAGVRGLQREIMTLVRKVVTKLTKDKKLKHIEITVKELSNYLGVKRYLFGQTEENDRVGIVTGLAWTQVGGELLTIEGVMMPGRGRMTVTGNLKDVMKESISAAASYVRSRAAEFGIRPDIFYKRDIHVHVPEGATPKDGPSAGIAMMTVIISVLTGIPVRNDIAMTGEVTLRGRVLPIGGLKEKLLAALRGGVKTVLIPKENVKDMVDIPENVKNSLEIIPVAYADEVLKHALVKKLKPIKWSDEINFPEDPEKAFSTDEDLFNSRRAH